MSPWKETAPGRFERPFDSVEMFFVALARGTAPINREHYSLNIAAKFQAPFSAEDAVRRFKNAWIIMRYDHPEIASTLQGDTKVYEVPDALGLDAWLRETFVVATDTTVSQTPQPDTPPLSEPVLNSLGVIDPYLDRVHGDLEIKGFFLGGEIDTRQVMCHLWTWRGEMVLSACYNGAFYEPRCVRGFQEQTFGILLTKLGVGK